MCVCYVCVIKAVVTVCVCVCVLNSLCPGPLLLMQVLMQCWDQ